MEESGWELCQGRNREVKLPPEIVVAAEEVILCAGQSDPEEPCRSPVVGSGFSFSGNLALTMGTNVILAGLGVLTGTVSARLLGPSGRGELAAVQNLYWLVGVFALLGLPEATLYFGAKQREKSGEILASALGLSLVVAPAFVLVALPFVHLLLSEQSPELIRFASWYLVAIPLLGTMGLPAFAIRGQNDFVRWNLLRIFPAAGWAVALVLAFAVHKTTAEGLAVAYLIVLAVLTLPTAIFVLRYLSRPLT